MHVRELQLSFGTCYVWESDDTREVFERVVQLVCDGLDGRVAEQIDGIDSETWRVIVASVEILFVFDPAVFSFYWAGEDPSATARATMQSIATLLGNAKSNGSGLASPVEA